MKVNYIRDEELMKDERDSSEYSSKFSVLSMNIEKLNHECLG